MCIQLPALKKESEKNRTETNFCSIWCAVFNLFFRWLTFEYGYRCMLVSVSLTTEEIYFVPVSIAKLFSRIIGKILVPV